MKDLTDVNCYCINLKNRPDRRRLFMNQSALDLLPQIHYIDAVVGNSLDVKNDDRIGILTRVQVLTHYRRSHYERKGRRKFSIIFKDYCIVSRAC